MKNKTIIFLSIIISMICIILLLISGNYIFKLEEQLSKKDTLIEKTLTNKSEVDQKIKEYADKITKYIENCNFYIDGTKISQKEVVQITNRALDDNLKYQDTIARLKLALENVKRDYGVSYNVVKKGDTLISKRDKKNDSVYYYYLQYRESLEGYRRLRKEYYKTLENLESLKWQLELVKEDYGISYDISRRGDSLYSYRNRETKIDSALVLFEYFKDRLYKDENGNWKIKTDREYRRQQRRKKQ